MESRDAEAPVGPDDAPAHYAERTDDDTSPQTGDGVTPQGPPAGADPDGDGGSAAPKAGA
jgi:hypothetical protein